MHSTFNLLTPMHRLEHCLEYLFCCIMHVWLSHVGWLFFLRHNGQMFWLQAWPQRLKVVDTAYYRRLESRWAECDISKRHSAEQEKPLNIFLPWPLLKFTLKQQNKQWQGGEELQTPHPACVKINLLKGGDLCVFNNHGNCNGHATMEGLCAF